MNKNTVSPKLTPTPRAHRRRNHVENDEFGAFARRIIRAYARRVGAGDIEALADMVALSEDLDHAIGDAVTHLHDAHNGYSWTEIGARLGITRQSAHKRWGRS